MTLSASGFSTSAYSWLSQTSGGMSDASSERSSTSGCCPSPSTSAVIGFPVSHARLTRCQSSVELCSGSSVPRAKPRRQRSMLTKQLESSPKSSPPHTAFASSLSPFSDNDAAYLSDTSSAAMEADLGLAMLRAQLKPLALSRATSAPLAIPDTTELRDKLQKQAADRLKAAVEAEDFQRARIYFVEQRARQMGPLQ